MRGDLYHGDVIDTRRRRPLPQPQAELLDRHERSAGQYLDAPVGKVACIARHTQCPGAVTRAGSEVNALYATGNEGATSDPVAQG